MPTEYAAEVSLILKYIAESLDISPTDYDRAIRSYSAVGECLQNGHEKGFYDGCDEEPAVYPQGSINLGTIVRPIRDGKEADFDVDLVCELNALKENSVPGRIKKQVGLCLKDHATYKDKLEPEGKRCWTITYAESAGIGFHMDVLPCVPCPEDDHPDHPGAVSLTNKDKYKNSYDWRPGCPKGYASWFRNKNSTFESFASFQKERLFEFCNENEDVLMKCASVEDIPDQLVRTPLQRAIQLMKRHRDIHFSQGPDYKPISIIITTLAAHLYQGEHDVYPALKGIVDRMLMHRDFLQNQYASIDESVAQLSLITRNAKGKWVIANPVNEGENFADRWHEDNHARANSFFRWAQKLTQDIQDIPIGKDAQTVASYLEQIFGERVAKEAVRRLDDSVETHRLLPSSIKRPSKFDVPYRQKPPWQMAVSRRIELEATVHHKREGFRLGALLSGQSKRLSKKLWIRFTAKGGVENVDSVEWRVVNTGPQALAAEGGGRGGFYPSDGGKYMRWEKTEYKGDHCIEAFGVKDGICVARSGEFVVPIE